VLPDVGVADGEAPVAEGEVFEDAFALELLLGLALGLAFAVCV